MLISETRKSYKPHRKDTYKDVTIASCGSTAPWINAVRILASDLRIAKRTYCPDYFGLFTEKKRTAR